VFAEESVVLEARIQRDNRARTCGLIDLAEAARYLRYLGGSAVSAAR
jgi:hypothetical protein